MSVFLLLGVASLSGCLGVHMCNTDTVLRVNEGERFNISISLVFQYGGPRGVNQPITRVRLVNTGDPNLSIFFCTMTSNQCTVRAGTPYTGRLTYSGQRSPWSNITVTIDKAMISDNGTYTIQVDTLNPSGQITTILSSTVTIFISKGKVCVCAY